MGGGLAAIERRNGRIAERERDRERKQAKKKEGEKSDRSRNSRAFQQTLQ